MGALASLEQRDEVLKSLRGLTKSAQIVVGDPENFDVVGADKATGAFLPPILLRSDDKDATEPHDIEAFGPVSTVIGYDSTDDVDRTRRPRQGQPRRLRRHRAIPHSPATSCLASPRSTAASSSSTATTRRNPPATARRCPSSCTAAPDAQAAVRNSAASAASCTTCSAPRSRPPPTSSPRSGTWVTGSQRNDDGIHPFRKNLAQLRIGDTIVGGPRQVTLADIDHFAEFTGDTFYAHTDPEAAAANPLFGGIVAHGYLVVSLAAGLFVDPIPVPVLANFGVDNLRFLTPVKADDSLTVTLTAKLITPRSSADYGEVRWDAVVVNQDGDPVATYDVLTLVAKGENA